MTTPGDELLAEIRAKNIELLKRYSTSDPLDLMDMAALVGYTLGVDSMFAVTVTHFSITQAKLK